MKKLFTIFTVLLVISLFATGPALGLLDYEGKLATKVDVHKSNNSYSLKPGNYDIFPTKHSGVFLTVHFIEVSRANKISISYQVSGHDKVETILERYKPIMVCGHLIHFNGKTKISEQTMQNGGSRLIDVPIENTYQLTILKPFKKKSAIPDKIILERGHAYSLPDQFTDGLYILFRAVANGDAIYLIYQVPGVDAVELNFRHSSAPIYLFGYRISTMNDSNFNVEALLIETTFK